VNRKTFERTSRDCQAVPASARELVWFWFGLVGFSFNASLGPKRRARKRGRLAEAALAVS
jgi:hypothetical protein